jgi:subtilisin family serine protease
MLPKYEPYTGSNVTFAVLDTGLAPHQHFDHRDITFINCTGEPSGRDKDGHGTHVTGVIKAHGPNMIGLCPKARILSIKVLGDSGNGNIHAINRGLITALENQADIVVMSLGTRKYFKPLHNTIKKLYRHNIIMFAAAGNFEDGKIQTEDILFPGKLKETICVGATNNIDQVADFSSMGRQLDFVAPGVNIWSTWPGNIYGLLSGTSQATPIAAGIAGVILDRHKKEPGRTPINTPEDMLTHLQWLCRDIGIAGKDVKSGRGILRPNSLSWREFSVKD